MESARPLQPKVPSPTYSVASKDEPLQHTVEQSSHMKEGEVASEVKATNNDMNSSDKKAIINTPASEDVPESLSMKGPKSFESAPVPEDAQEKQLAGEQGKKFVCVLSHSLCHLPIEVRREYIKVVGILFSCKRLNYSISMYVIENDIGVYDNESLFF